MVSGTRTQTIEQTRNTGITKQIARNAEPQASSLTY